MAWVFLIFADVCEMVWPLGFKYTDGFKTNTPAIVRTFMIMLLSFWLLSQATARGIHVGIAYAVWTGIGHRDSRNDPVQRAARPRADSVAWVDHKDAVGRGFNGAALHERGKAAPSQSMRAAEVAIGLPSAGCWEPSASAASGRAIVISV